MTTPIRPARVLFGRRISTFPWPIFAIGALGLLIAYGAPYVFPQLKSKPAVEPMRALSELRSADGRVVCFETAKGLACLPAWLLDRPKNWVVMYPTPKERK